ncbi:MAG: hypothetical protein PHX43_04385 [Alphaproteobacteria bacterium]|nr:hypothetical protein [Alphaproteobacteria bacterium]
MFRFFSTCLALVFLIVGCAGSEMSEAKKTAGRPPVLAEVPNADETVRGEDDPAIVTLELKAGLRERRLSRSEELPGSIIVPATNLNGVPLVAALQAVLSGTDVSLSWDSKSWEDKLITVTNLSGPLPRVVEKICGSARVFCSYRHGLLEIKEKETFIIELPSMPETGGGSSSSSTMSSGSSSGTSSILNSSSGRSSSSSSSTANSMAEAITELAGEKVKIDQQGGNLIYTTDVDGQESVREYLDQLRNGRPLVVMQLYIWEVTLSRANAAGINWSSFDVPKIGGNWETLKLAGSTAFSSVTSPGVSLGATLAGKVNAASVLKFLSTQGQVQTISSPQLTFVSGANAEFRVGGKQRYVSQVGQLVTSNVSGSSSSSGSGIGTNTVSTDSVDTGLIVDVNGSFESGVIIANLEITMQNLIKMEKVDSGNGTEIQLPVTSDRKVSTMIRVRPGDNLVLAGMVSSRDTNDREGIPMPFGGRLPTMGSDKLENSELVILVKPSVVLFSDKALKLEEKRKEINTSYSRPLPDAVMIDKDGPQTISMMDTTVSKKGAARAAQTSAIKNAVTEERRPASLIKSSHSSKESAIVDKSMMQSGFSQAYDGVGAEEDKL